MKSGIQGVSPLRDKSKSQNMQIWVFSFICAWIFFNIGFVECAFTTVLSVFLFPEMLFFFCSSVGEFWGAMIFCIFCAWFCQELVFVLINNKTGNDQSSKCDSQIDPDFQL